MQSKYNLSDITGPVTYPSSEKLSMQQHLQKDSFDILENGFQIIWQLIVRKEILHRGINRNGYPQMKWINAENFTPVEI